MNGAARIIRRRAVLAAAALLPMLLPGMQEPSGYVVSVDVPLVVLHATVQDPHGMPVSGLTGNDIQVFENGVPQTVKYFQHEDVPVTAGIIVDHSGSMGPNIKRVISAAETFARLSNPMDQIFVVNFNEHVLQGLPPGILFTSDPAALETAINDFPVTGKTALYDAVFAGIGRVNLGERKEKVLIVITDGRDNASEHTLREVTEAAEKSDVVVYCIGLLDPLDPHSDPGVLKQLARRTGGEAFFPTENAQVVEICERIAKDIRAQYTIGYIPANSRRDGAWRTIRVAARAPARGKVEVRTRTGYYASTTQ